MRLFCSHKWAHISTTKTMRLKCSRKWAHTLITKTTRLKYSRKWAHPLTTKTMRLFYHCKYAHVCHCQLPPMSVAPNGKDVYLKELSLEQRKLVPLHLS